MSECEFCNNGIRYNDEKRCLETCKYCLGKMIMKTKYTIWDMLFSRFKWYRERSEYYWAKDPNHALSSWVKFTHEELEEMARYGIKDGPKYDGLLVEDYRKTRSVQ